MVQLSLMNVITTPLNKKALHLVSLVLEVLEFGAIEGHPPLLPGPLTLLAAGAQQKYHT